MFKEWQGVPPGSIVPVAADGSNRQYYRLRSPSHSAIGVYNADTAENAAFVAFSAHFRKYLLPVPRIYGVAPDSRAYLQQDFEDTTLFKFLNAARKSAEDFPQEAIDMYKKVVVILPRFQIIAGRDVDYGVCHSRKSFDARSIVWDLQYFKYCFLRLVDIVFDEDGLENDFAQFAEYLMRAEQNFFLYRDLQSRNIMVQNNRPYFIDYQGGRKGALQYDIASLLFDPRAHIPPEVREEILEQYVATAEQFIPLARDEFFASYPGYVVIRICQALGTYGLRGLYEKKTHFVESIAPALRNLDGVINSWSDMKRFPSLEKVFRAIIAEERLYLMALPENKTDKKP